MLHSKSCKFSRRLLHMFNLDIFGKFCWGKLLVHIYRIFPLSWFDSRSLNSSVQSNVFDGYDRKYVSILRWIQWIQMIDLTIDIPFLDHQIKSMMSITKWLSLFIYILIFKSSMFCVRIHVFFLSSDNELRDRNMWSLELIVYDFFFKVFKRTEDVSNFALSFR